MSQSARTFERREPASRRLVLRAARALVPVLSAALTIQPAAYAAPPVSLLSQSPMFLDQAAPANVVFIMDDSSSMNDTKLPLPPGVNPPSNSGGCPAGQVRIKGGLCVESADWVHRAPALNPLYYNPAMTYRPWNDNGRAGLTGNFTQSSTAATFHASNWFREGQTPHDMRYTGPNYAYGVGNNFTRLRTTTGANPPAGHGYPGTSPANDGFYGASDGARNQDLFSSPFVWVTSTASYCTAPFAADSSPQPYSARASSARPSTTRGYTVRTDNPPTWTAPTTTAPTVTNLDVINRTITERTITTRATSSRTITERTITTRATSARTITTRPTEWRQETGVCGVWGPWSTAGPPPTAYCTIPGTEGNVRVANVESRLQPCPSGTSEYGPNQCATNCASGWTADGPICRQNCPAGTTNHGSTQCISDCPSGTSTYGSTQCISNCPSGYHVGPSTTQCRQNCGGTIVSGGPTGWQCQTCSTGTLSGGQCLSCSGGATLDYNASAGAYQCRSCQSGTSWTGAACRTNCLAGQEAATFGGQNVCFHACPASHPTAGTGAAANTCYGPCPSGTSTVGGFPTDTCYANCAPGQTAGVVGGQPVCYLGCAAPAWLSGSYCRSCPAGSSRIGSTDFCCPSGSTAYGNCPTQTSADAPWNSTCSTASRWYPDLSQPALARYYVYEPPAGASGPPTPPQLSDPANYRLVQINRDPPARLGSFQTPHVNNDPTQPRAIRTDCAGGTTCTWEEEAKNFANWFTYYRTRLFAAIGVTAEALSKLTAANGLDKLRLAYGSINYFPNGPNPYAADPASNRLPASMSIDGQPSEGAIVRGVRPFTEVTPPSAPGSNDRRQEVFDWLFSLRGYGATPNREALDAVGRYLARSDSSGPWIRPDSSSSWVSSEAPAAHLSCRRNYALLVTDGEWTRNVAMSPPSQPLIENRTSSGLPAGFLAFNGYAPLTGRTTTGPVIHGSGVAAGRTYQYPDPVHDRPWSNVAGNPTGTLTDVALFWWSRDLRPDLPNNLKPIEVAPPGRDNPAFWQHMVSYIVGYGLNASMNTTATRDAVANNSAVAWPTVVLENRPAENPHVIVTDRDRFPPAPAADRCAYDAVSNPNGCGRLNDTLRAGLAARGDFLSANSVEQLAQSVASVFDAIGEQEGSGTSVAGRAASLREGDRLFFASFVSGRWTGQVSAYDAVAWFNAVRTGSAEPAPVWTSSFPTWSARTLLTATAPVGSGAWFATLADLSATQRGYLGNSQAVLDYLRGDQSRETSNGGPYRRRLSLLGDIVNSSPLYSKAPNFGYSAARAPAAAGAGAASYPAYVAANANPTSGRRAAVYVGANDGMLHAFAADTGVELFGYVPRGVYPMLTALTSPGYSHRFYVDGPVVEGDVYWGGAWRTVLVGTAGAGAKSVFALDVTNPASFGASNVLWEINQSTPMRVGDAADPQYGARLGFTLGQAVVVKLN
ncbi:MAG: PilC/PilY family type IV pilus protein, partial [Burkholderiaceae bacterium]|nr:PilC/PilY family type IV pilus protein [Burkholderiaceae bacterium]